MVKALTFKGDKKPKKRKRATPKDDPTDPTTSTALTTSASNAEPDEDDSWVSAEVSADLVGPIIFVLPSDEPSCLASDANGKVFASALENIVEGDITTAEPHDVRQVWVANRAAGTEGLSFKGHHGRYLSSNKLGVLTATHEAISPEEAFVCIPSPDTPGTFALQTVRETYLTIKATTSAALPEIRGNAEDINFNSTFRIRMQARFKPRLKASKAELAKQKISRKELEDVVGRRLDDDEARKLKKARREGTYHEAILDVRVKGKHDKFAS